MSELTKEQIAKVARVVTGRRVKIRHDGTVWVGGICKSVPWTPMFGSDPQSRSQALAIVEHLFKTLIERHINLNMTQHYYETYVQMVADYVHQKDINGLMELV